METRRKQNPGYWLPIASLTEGQQGLWNGLQRLVPHQWVRVDPLESASENSVALITEDELRELSEIKTIESTSYGDKIINKTISKLANSQSKDSSEIESGGIFILQHPFRAENH